MIITITLNAALDRTQRIEHPLQVGKLNRAVSSHLEPGGKGINVSRAIKALGGSSIALGFSAGTHGELSGRGQYLRSVGFYAAGVPAEELP